MMIWTDAATSGGVQYQFLRRPGAVRVAFVGAGAIARAPRGARLAGHVGHQVVAVCDPIARAGAEPRPAPAPRPTPTGGRCSTPSRPDAVFVCSPPADPRAAGASAALERGIAVYLEKPLARSLADGRGDRGGLGGGGARVRGRLPVAQPRRGRRRPRAPSPARRPGLLVSRSFGPTEPAPRRSRLGRAGLVVSRPRAQSGGILFELGSHDIDLQLALAGPVESVQARAARGRLALAGATGRRLHDAVSVSLRFAAAASARSPRRLDDARAPPVYTLDVLAADVTLRARSRPRLPAARPGRRRARSRPPHGRPRDSVASSASSPRCERGDRGRGPVHAARCARHARRRPRLRAGDRDRASAVRWTAGFASRACRGSAAGRSRRSRLARSVPVRWSAWISRPSVAVT